MRYAVPPQLAVFAVFAVFGGFTAAHAASPNMRDGMWEITTKMEMAGNKGAQMPQQTVKHCMTKQDVADPRRATPGAGDPGRCKMTDYKMQGNTASWKLACTGDGSGTGSGTVTFSGDSYSGSQTMYMKRGGQVMTMKMDYSGRRVGDCPKK